MSVVDKEPTGVAGQRPWCFSPRARDGYKCLLEHLAPRDSPRGDSVVLLPWYVGCSPLEGSGLGDPIQELGLSVAFYRLGPELQVDLDRFQEALWTHRPFVVLAVHYFGFPVRELYAMRRLADDAGAVLVEDCAHVVGPEGSHLGTVGDYAFYSLHKWLGCAGGGLLQANHGRDLPEGPASIALEDLLAFAQADLGAIRSSRRANYEALLALIADLPGVVPLHGELAPDTVPLNLPVRLTRADRFQTYKRLRARGIGAVALYHTLHPWLDAASYPEAHQLSRQILNLPIHQDLGPELVQRVAEELADALRP